ncbi:hypothetical protein ABZZ17_34655 [Streptomyces sp. NPDC006512]|uniref:hypothetical protein n=1 Tax=Streptomyces sp. NPDC006512 TaxID=3154307 RepID=UPI0033A87689
MITEDDVDPATLAAGMLRPAWRHGLYRALEAQDHTAALTNALDRAAAVARASAAQLRQIVETVVREGHEELGRGFVHHPDISGEYLLELCDRGVLTDALGHRAGPRGLLVRMCEVHRYPEAVLTLGLELYRDPAVPPDEFAAFVRQYGGVSRGWLLRALAETDPDPALKLTAYEDALTTAAAAGDTGREAAGFHARYLATAPSGDAGRLARFLDRHPDAHVLALLLESSVPDPVRGELIAARARESADPRVSDALRRREQRREAASASLDAEAAAELAATGLADVLALLAANPRTPRPILRELSTRAASPGARAIRNAAAHTLRLTRGHPEGHRPEPHQQDGPHA